GHAVDVADDALAADQRDMVAGILAQALHEAVEVMQVDRRHRDAAEPAARVEQGAAEGEEPASVDLGFHRRADDQAALALAMAAEILAFGAVIGTRREGAG